MRTWLLYATLLTVSVSGNLLAQTTPPARYRLDQFTSAQGLPGHQIFDIEQTSDGYLWVATNTRLVRFDGHRFAVSTADTLLPTNKGVTSLYLNAGDTLFAVTRGAVLRYADEAFAPYAALDYKRSLLGNLAQDRDGRLWGTYEGDLLRDNQGRFELSIPALTTQVGQKQLFVDGRGEVWLALPNEAVRSTNPVRSCYAVQDAPARLARLDQGRPVPQGPTLYPYLITYPARAEVLFARMQGDAIAFTNPEGEPRGRFRLPEQACPLLMDRQGLLWVKEGATLVTYAPEETEPVSRIELGIRPQPTALPRSFEDREGNLWIGTFSQGLFRIRRNLFQVYGTAQGIEQAPIKTMISGKDGSVLITDRAGRVYRVKNRHLLPLLDKVAGLYEDEAGSLLYMYSDEPRGKSGIVRLNEGREQPLADFPFEGGTLNHQIYADPQEEGVYWTHTYTTVYRLDAPIGATPRLAKVLEGLTSVRQLFKDRTGLLWVATGGGIYRQDGDHFTHFTMEDGLPSNSVRAIHEDPDGVLWFGTYGSGLVRYKDGRFQTVDERQGLAENVVSTILEDEHGYFWMSGNKGVHRAHRPALNALLDGERESIIAVQYGRESGLLNPEASGLPGLKAADGRLWFPTFEGAAVVDPGDALTMGREPPIVHIQEVVVNNQPVRLPGTVQLAAGQRRFEIAYVGLNLRNPEGVRYRYRLDGFDADWIEAGTARRATYTNVTPGTHTFRVQARNDAGLWSEADAVLTLSVAPYFYETPWFYLLCLLTVLGLSLGAYRVRIRQLKAREDALSRLVQKRTQDLTREKETVAAQAEALRSLDEAKSRFFANISHEFRTPLTLILGPLEDLQDGLHGSFSSSGRRQIDTAIRNGRRLLRLVSQLLDVSRLESGKITLQAQEHDMHAFAERLVQAFTPMAERKDIAFRFEGPGHPLPVYFDPEQFEKVLANLLGNAFKFTPEQGTVLMTLSTEEAQNGSGTMVLAVRDSGPGIAPDHLPHLFERFYQADASSTRRQQGTGIGLALVKNLVELHHGTVEVESHVGLGTTFTVRLPLGRAHLSDAQVVPSDGGEDGFYLASVLGRSPAPFLVTEITPVTTERSPEPHASQAGSEMADEAKTVLVVDDKDEVRDYVRSHLEPRYRVLEAAEGRAALQQARRLVPDLIISDVMMPDLDGYGLCRAIRQDPELSFIPIILLTAKASEDSRLAGLDTGADAYLTKPFNMRELLLRVDNLMTAQLRLKQHLQAKPSSAYDPSLDPPPLINDFVAQVRRIIEAHLTDESFGVDDLAAALHLSRSTLYRRLDEAASVAPMDLIWTTRLAHAATLLAEAQGTVSEVAYGVGFKSVAHFSRRFQAAYGVSPSAYAQGTRT